MLSIMVEWERSHRCECACIQKLYSASAVLVLACTIHIIHVAIAELGSEHWHRSLCAVVLLKVSQHRLSKLLIL